VKQANISVRNWLIIFSLVLAGEMIFSLPFHVARFFRPTFLEVFQVTNTELGDAFFLYGLFAMLAYFPGGPIADRFSVRKLLSLSLLLTGLGGFYLAQIPGLTGLSVLFGYWGVTTIFLFWAGLIRATREWGGKLKQGLAFGVLDGGRGLIAAGVASLAVILLSHMLRTDAEQITILQRTKALKTIILLYSFLTIGTAILFGLLSQIPHQTHQRLSNLYCWVSKQPS
jgi:MFS family permease